MVGRGAETRAKEFLALLDRFPAIREQVRASVLVGERRWNLRLKNGLDVRLPETEVAGALEHLVDARPRGKKLLTRDIAVVDMRLSDRVTVRLSERGRAGAAGAAQGADEEGQEGRARMTVLQFGLTPKTKPLSPKRSALVAALDVGTSKIACLIARLKPQPAAGRAAPAQPYGRRYRLRAHLRARHQGRRRGRSAGRRGGDAPGHRSGGALRQAAA